jgi:hypothetical protein
MMYLKIMGSENMPDHDSSKPHTMLTVSEYAAYHDTRGELFITYQIGGNSHQSRVYSNIYVMNADGKTINTISPPQPVPQ